MITLDPNITTLLAALIVGGFSVATLLITNRNNRKQNEVSLRFRLTETAFNARLQAFGELATAAQTMNASVIQLTLLTENARDYNKQLPDGNYLFQPGMEDRVVDSDLELALKTSAESYLHTYYRTRMYLTPTMDNMADEIRNGVAMQIMISPAQDAFTYGEAEFLLSKILQSSRVYVDKLTTEMCKYIASVEKGE
jgi:hypothetical protein